MSPQPNGSYSGDPTTSPLDEVRFLVGDTGWGGALWQLADAEIMYQLLIVNPPPAIIPPNGNYLAASYCADDIAARYKMLIDKSVGDLHIAYSKLALQFTAIAIRLRKMATIATVPFYVGGLNRQAKNAAISNPNLLGTAVVIDGMDSELPLKQVPGASGYSGE
jgi:hypothetical protein